MKLLILIVIATPCIVKGQNKEPFPDTCGFVGIEIKNRNYLLPGENFLSIFTNEASIDFFEVELIGPAVITNKECNLFTINVKIDTVQDLDNFEFIVSLYMKNRQNGKVYLKNLPIRDFPSPKIIFDNSIEVKNIVSVDRITKVRYLSAIFDADIIGVDDLQAQVLKFNITKIDDRGKLVTLENNGWLFSDPALELLQSSKLGDIYIFSEITTAFPGFVRGIKHLDDKVITVK